MDDDIAVAGVVVLTLTGPGAGTPGACDTALATASVLAGVVPAADRSRLAQPTATAASRTRSVRREARRGTTLSES